MAAIYKLLLCAAAVTINLLPSRGNNHGTYNIPVTFNPLLQKSVGKSEDSNLDIFYTMDPDFYSNITVIDAAAHSGGIVSEMIAKSISVIFLTMASSHISGTIKLRDLRYLKKSKWSYTLSVKSIIDASRGTITNLTDATVIYRIQESAMDILSNRYDFTVDDISSKLGLTTMQFYGVDESQWIKAVGLITDKLFRNRADQVKLTPCYLAQMIQKTEKEIAGFTFNDVDQYLYELDLLHDKIPNFTRTTIQQLYQTFNLSAGEFEKLAGIDISTNSKDLLTVMDDFTAGILAELEVERAQIIESHENFQQDKMILSCSDDWKLFEKNVVAISFNNTAKHMSLGYDTLASLLHITPSIIDILTIGKMQDLLHTSIKPLQVDKKMLEEKTLSETLKEASENKESVTGGNAFSSIRKFTKLTREQLSILYQWSSHDYSFAAIFSLKDIEDVCSINIDGYTLLQLATINTGAKLHGFPCHSFRALRQIWDEQNLGVLSGEFLRGQGMPLDLPISSTISLLTNASAPVNNRVLNVTSAEEMLLTIISLVDFLDAAAYSRDQLSSLPFQEIIQKVVRLDQEGKFKSSTDVSTQSSSSYPTSPWTAESSTFSPSVLPSPMTYTSLSSRAFQGSDILTTSVVTTETYVTSTMSGKSDDLRTPSTTSPLSRTIQPSKTKPTPSLSKSTEVVTCKQQSCKSDQICVLTNSGGVLCKDGLNVQGNFKITSQQYSDDLGNMESEPARQLSRKITELIDAKYKNSPVFGTSYYGSEVVKFLQGSVIVYCKMSFSKNMHTTGDTLNEIKELLTNLLADTNIFAVDQKSINVSDFDECSTDNVQNTSRSCYVCKNTLLSYECVCPDGMSGDGITCQVVTNSPRSDDDTVPWIIYVVIAVMVVLIIFLIIIIFYCERRQKKKYRPQVLDFHNGGINMYPRSTSYLAQTPESEADLADGLGIVNRRAPAPDMVTFNPSPDKKEPVVQSGQPGVFQYKF